MEREMRRLEEEMAIAPPAKAQELAHVHGELQERFQAIDDSSSRRAPRRSRRARLPAEGPRQAARGALRRLGNARVARAPAAREADLLLLDEPTNHLDLESVVWLEQFLATTKARGSRQPRSLLPQPDGRRHRGALASGVNLYPAATTTTRGARGPARPPAEAGGDAAEEDRGDRALHRALPLQGDEGAQAQSRMKQLAKVDRIEAPKRKKRVLRIRPPRSAAIRRGGDHARAGEEELRRDGRLRRAGLRDAARGEDRTRRSERRGKSTLLKLMAGVTELSGGMRRLGHNVTQYYYAQHQADALDPTQTIVEALREVMPMDRRARARDPRRVPLQRRRRRQEDQRALRRREGRVALARMLGEASNLLLMDEPTNTSTSRAVRCSSRRSPRSPERSPSSRTTATSSTRSRRRSWKSAPGSDESEQGLPLSGRLRLLDVEARARGRRGRSRGGRGEGLERERAEREPGRLRAPGKTRAARKRRRRRSSPHSRRRSRRGSRR